MEGTPSGLARNPIAIIGVLVFLVGFVVFAVEGFASVNSPPVPSSTPGFPIGVLCGFGIAGLGMVIIIVAGLVTRSAPIPPPPPIQQPMVPAGTQRPVGLNCPACGAPAQDMDRFGVATCPHCGTRFLVR